jgi:hypothetical protein
MLIIINLSGDRYYHGRVVGVESELIARFANNKAMMPAGVEMRNCA